MFTDMTRLTASDKVIGNAQAYDSTPNDHNICPGTAGQAWICRSLSVLQLVPNVCIQAGQNCIREGRGS